MKKTFSQRGRASRLKGQRGEREFFKILSELLGYDIKRNLSQTRDGGADSLCVDGWMIEVKYREQSQLGKWWRKIYFDATNSDRKPLLAYRANHKEWVCAISAQDIFDLDDDIKYCFEYVLLSPLLAAEVIRKTKK